MGLPTTLFVVAVLASCTKSEPRPEPKPAPAAVVKDPGTAQRMITAGALVLDVRSPTEYSDGHLVAAVNIPIQDLPSRLAEVDKLAEHDKTHPIVVYCAKGGRAAKAKAALEAAGYSHVVNGGGLDDLE